MEGAHGAEEDRAPDEDSDKDSEGSIETLVADLGSMYYRQLLETTTKADTQPAGAGSAPEAEARLTEMTLEYAAGGAGRGGACDRTRGRKAGRTGSARPTHHR